jgi:hypothetical protein
MSKIKDKLEELSELAMQNARETVSVDLYNDTAVILQIITSALVELGESTSTEKKSDNKFVSLQTVDWEGKKSIIVKFKLSSVNSYNEALQVDKELKLLEINISGSIYYIKMNKKELEKLLVGGE